MHGDYHDDHRPDPEALLAAAQQETRGHLKIFLGPAPGVGKTYTMLEAGYARKSAGVDVVVGVIETHGRQETEALLRDLEIIPQRSIKYHGVPIARDGPGCGTGAPAPIGAG